MFLTWMRGDFWQKLHKCPKLPHIHAGLCYNTNPEGCSHGCKFSEMLGMDVEWGVGDSIVFESSAIVTSFVGSQVF